jgi:alanine dehydrogenase
MNITYKDYLDAKAIILAFKKNINFEIDDLIIENKNVKEKVFMVLKNNEIIRTVDLAYNLRISKQLAHKYKKQYFDSLLK